MAFVDEIETIKNKQAEAKQSEVECWYKERLTAAIKACCLDSHTHSVEGWIQVGTPRDFISVTDSASNVIARNFRLITPQVYNSTAYDPHTNYTPDTSFYGHGGCNELDFKRAVEITKAVIVELGFKQYNVKIEEAKKTLTKTGLFKKEFVYTPAKLHVTLKW